MKIILAGSTGFIGREVLCQCLQNPSITSIVALSRRELDPPAELAGEWASKVKVVIMSDFLTYSKEVLREMEGAEGCIWALGTIQHADPATTRTVSIEYTLAAARAMTSLVDQGARKFRFIYVSGGLAERDQTKSLWFMQEYRRIRGQVETDLLAFTSTHADVFSTVIVRPGMVLAKKSNIVKDSIIRALLPNVKVDQLAGVMVRKVVGGKDKDKGQEVLENGDIKAYSLA